MVVLAIFFSCFIDNKSSAISLRILQLDVDVETKTKDDVFVIAKVAVQYQIIQEKAYDAFYKLNNPRGQIMAYVYDVIRQEIPKLELDDVFAKKDDVALAVKKELSETMYEFGYLIVQALLTDIDPARDVKNAMNEINAQKRLRIAANEKGEADKILRVKAAEAEAQSKKLQGEGIANQRKAIIDGLKQSVEDFGKAVEGATPQDVMNLVLITQFFDTIKEIGGQSNSNTLMIPDGMAGFMEQIKMSMMSEKSKTGSVIVAGEERKLLRRQGGL